MRGFVARLGLAALALASACTLGSYQASALSQTFSFDGIITDLDDPGSVTGILLNDHITGSITFDPVVSNDPDHVFSLGNDFNETGSFAFSGPSTGPFSVSGAGNWAIQSINVHGNVQLNFVLGADDDNLINLNFGNAGFHDVLDHLSSLPGDAASLTSLLGDGYTGTGFIKYLGAAYNFDIVTPSAVPIPASVWLFVSALGGIGLLGWARRRQAMPMAAA